MKIFYCDQFVLPLPEGHRFPMAKYARLRQRVEADRLAPMAVPAPVSLEALRLVHDPDYVDGIVAGTLDPMDLRRIGFPWSPAMVERSRRSVGATVEACRFALQAGYGVNLAGGTHHAGVAQGGGYCVFNDAAVAARIMQREGRARRVMVVDLDVHHGNGTAEIFAHDDSVYTFSMHGERNYPARKPPSDIDIPLPDGTTDIDYLVALQDGLSAAFERFSPDLVIYLAGADPYEGDRLGRLKLSKSGLLQRDQMVLYYAGRTPVAVCMAGGYADDVDDTVAIHHQTVAIIAQQKRA
ncbi:MAG TPA: histone deacetylase [Candidatus Xenobia bacterium]